MTNAQQVDRISNRRVECHIAQTPCDREQIYRLRYTGYRRDKSIGELPEQLFHDDFDEMPNSFSFLARAGGEAMATVRISVVRPDLGWHSSPVGHVYGDHPALQSMASQGFVEASRLVFAQQARRDAFVRLVGHMAALASFYDAGWLVACPRVEHATTYRKMFGFKPVAEPRQYIGVGFQTILLTTSREELQNYVQGARALINAWSDALARYTSTAGSVNALRPRAD